MSPRAAARPLRVAVPIAGLGCFWGQRERSALWDAVGFPFDALLAAAACVELLWALFGAGMAAAQALFAAAAALQAAAAAILAAAAAQALEASGRRRRRCVRGWQGRRRACAKVKEQVPGLFKAQEQPVQVAEHVMQGPLPFEAQERAPRRSCRPTRSLCGPRTPTASPRTSCRATRSRCRRCSPRTPVASSTWSCRPTRSWRWAWTPTALPRTSCRPTRSWAVQSSDAGGVVELVVQAEEELVRATDADGITEEVMQANEEQVERLDQVAKELSEVVERVMGIGPPMADDALLVLLDDLKARLQAAEAQRAPAAVTFEDALAFPEVHAEVHVEQASEEAQEVDAVTLAAVYKLLHEVQCVVEAAQAKQEVLQVQRPPAAAFEDAEAFPEVGAFAPRPGGSVRARRAAPAAAQDRRHLNEVARSGGSTRGGLGR